MIREWWFLRLFYATQFLQKTLIIEDIQMIRCISMLMPNAKGVSPHLTADCGVGGGGGAIFCLP